MTESGAVHSVAVEPSSPAPQLRPYQLDLANRVVAQLKKGNATIAVLPTGAGKSIMAILGVWMMLGKPKTLVVVHTRVLKHQWGRYGMETRTWQSLLSSGIPKGVKLVIWDEAHHTPAVCYQEVRKTAHDRCMHLGLTATPYRGDGFPLGDLWDSIEAGPQTAWMQEKGFLSHTSVVVGVPPDVEKFRRSRSRTDNIDYPTAYLSRLTRKFNRTVFGNPALAWKEYANDRSTLVFCVDIKHAVVVKKLFLKEGIRAELILGTDKKSAQLEALRDFHAGGLKVLISVALLNEGWDAPACECVHILRPTRSRVLWRQMIGRGLRPSLNCCLILDQGGCYFNHGLVEDTESFSLQASSRVERVISRDKIVFEVKAAGSASRREVKHVTAAFIELSRAGTKEQRQLDRARRWVKHLSRTTWWVITKTGQTGPHKRDANLGKFHSQEGAIQWALHNVKLFDAGKPFEKKPPDVKTRYSFRLETRRYSTKKACYEYSVVSAFDRETKNTTGLGHFKKNSEAVRWISHNQELLRQGKPLERRKTLLSIKNWVKKHLDRWLVVANVEGRCIHLGSFPSKDEAVSWAQRNARSHSKSGEMYKHYEALRPEAWVSPTKDKKAHRVSGSVKRFVKGSPPPIYFGTFYSYEEAINKAIIAQKPFQAALELLRKNPIKLKTRGEYE